MKKRLLRALYLSIIAGTFLACPLDPPVPTPPPVDEDTVCLANIQTRASTSRFAAERFLTQPRIVGGVNAADGEFPWAIALTTTSGFQFCGAAYVGDGFAITAAHCRVKPGDLAVLGRVDLRTDAGEAFPVGSVATHANYNDQTSENDIALLKLLGDTSDFEGLLNTENVLGANEDVVVVGWGLTEENGTPSPTLRKVSLRTVTNESCDLVYGGITDTMLCAGIPEGGRDSCQGDSGGALIIQDNSRVQWQHGIVSFGFGCAQPGVPGVYTRTSEFVDWELICRTALK